MPCKSNQLQPDGSCLVRTMWDQSETAYINGKLIMCEKEKCKNKQYVQPASEIVFVTPYIIEMILRWRRELNK